MCIQNDGIFDGPTDASALQAIKRWKTNAVRVPLNEDCWLGINASGINPAYVGANYRNAVMGFVRDLNAAGFYAVLDLHWNAPGTTKAMEQQPMADAAHAIDFWASVAHAFRAYPAVMLDLYNEPNNISWSCWAAGCAITTSLGQWKTAGMEQMVNAVRKAGATQPIMLGGLSWASDLSEWISYVPKDPLKSSAANPIPGQSQLVASFHGYCGPPGTSTIAECKPYVLDAQQSVWPAVKSVSLKVPVVTGEFGEYDCSTTYVTPFMNFADKAEISYIGWAWIPYDCKTFPALISDYSGTPTAYGKGLKDHLATVVP